MNTHIVDCGTGTVQDISLSGAALTAAQAQQAAWSAAAQTQQAIAQQRATDHQTLQQFATGTAGITVQQFAAAVVRLLG